MVVLILFAFLAGIVTILSPCILPILPIVLSGSISSGKRRPLGIILGFIFSFTFFTLFLSAIVRLTGTSAEVLRFVSVVVIILFGISLLLPTFQSLSEKLFSFFSSKVRTNGQADGFLGGIVVGLSLGLVWTPCVGPIIASVITLASTSRIDSAALLLTLAYSIGTALPMLVIMYGGRTLLQKVPWLLPNTSKIQKAFGAIMILTALGIFFNIDRKFQTWVLQTFPAYGAGITKLEDNDLVKKQLEQVGRKPQSPVQTLDQMQKESQYEVAPEIISGGQWFNTAPLKLANLKGKVVLIDFWTYTCINCIRTLPYLREWNEEYRDKGLVIIGVHSPEFEFEKNPTNVEKAIKDFKLTYPIVQDNNFETWQAYNNRYWPAKYFVDKNGKIRSAHFGEGSYDESEKLIQQLLSETGSDVSSIPVHNKQYTTEAQTPETYLGYERMKGFTSRERIMKDQSATYSIPDILYPNTIAFEGTWLIGKERSQPAKGSSLVFNVTAKEVFLVMRSKTGTEGRVTISLDAKPISTDQAGEDVLNGTVRVQDDRLYKVIKLPKSKMHTLKLDFQDDNIEVYAFTFG